MHPLGSKCHPHMHAYTHTHPDAHAHAHTRTHTHTNTHTHTHTHTHVRTHIHTRTRTHTHTCAHTAYLQAVENNEDDLKDVSGRVGTDSKQTDNPSDAHQRKEDHKGLHQLAAGVSRHGNRWNQEDSESKGVAEMHSICVSCTDWFSDRDCLEATSGSSFWVHEAQEKANSEVLANEASIAQM